MRYSSVFALPSVFAVNSTAKVCSEDIVSTVAGLDFFSFIYNCVYDHATSPGSQACLSLFITETSAPIAGTCRDAYQALVDGLYTSIPAGGCTDPTLEAGALPNDWNCMDAVDTEWTAFYEATGSFPVQLCSSADIMADERRDFFTSLINIAWAFAPGLQSVSVCDYCYFDPFESALGHIYDINAGGNGDLLEECRNPSGPTDACLSSALIINARKIFEDCAGWDILFEGPVCTADDVAVVQTLIPSPYYAFATCAYKPSTAFCATVPAYLDQISTDTNSLNCVACYTDFQSALEVLAAAETVCESDVFSSACIEYNADVLIAFEACAGTTLNTDFTTAAPTTTISPATTDSPVTDNPATTETDAATTKSAMSIGILAAIVAMSLF